MRPLSRFALATLAPVLLLVLAATVGGVWPWVAVLYMTALIAGLDFLIASVSDSDGREFPAEPWLSAALAWLHFGLLGLGVFALTGQTGLGWAEQITLFVALGLFMGQVSNSNAHELIHSTSRAHRRLGTWVYISMLYGHHASAHVRVHHVHVGSDADPATARKGESFYAYALRAWVDGFRAGYAAEAALSARSSRWRMTPYVTYVAGAALVVATAFVIGGFGGMMSLVLLALYAQAQLLMSDYVQHYGLTRKPTAHGGLEPVSAHHSWNAPHVASSALMLNAPRHSDHHVHPTKPFDALAVSSETPTLPYPLPVMASLALWPGGWRRVMDWRVTYWN